MKNILRIAASALLALVLLSGCGSTKESSSEQASAGTTVEVRNRHWLSMEIYVAAPGQRVRLGRVGTGKTKTFGVPSYLLTGATQLRFVMESSGPSPVVLSETFTATPGDKILLVIPNTR